MPLKFDNDLQFREGSERIKQVTEGVVTLHILEPLSAMPMFSFTMRIVSESKDLACYVIFS